MNYMNRNFDFVQHSFNDSFTQFINNGQYNNNNNNPIPILPLPLQYIIIIL